MDGNSPEIVATPVMQGEPVRVGAIVLSCPAPKNLFAAMLRMHKDALPVPRTTPNPAYKRGDKPMMYATLGDISEAMKKPLETADLAVLAGSEMADGVVSVTTLVGHAGSGEWAATTLSAKPRDLSPQAVGASVTYLRRYGESALLNIVTEDDDDGNAASLPPERREARRAEEPRRAPPAALKQKGIALQEALAEAKRRQDSAEATRLFHAAWKDWLGDAPEVTRTYFTDLMEKSFGITPLAAANGDE